MSVHKTSRADDEILLRWMELREAGYSSGEIAEMYGEVSARIRSATNRVRSAYAASLKVTA